MFKYTKKNTYFLRKNNTDFNIISKPNLFKKIDNISKEQLISISDLPNICSPIIGLPDIHPGYGVPIGSCFASEEQDAVISCEAVGFDINCGIRLISTNLTTKDLDSKKLKELSNSFSTLPIGLSKAGIKISINILNSIFEKGINWAIEEGYEPKSSKDKIEYSGFYKGANSKYVSSLAKQRGVDQVGTLGQGNHFIDLMVVSEIFDNKTAKIYGLKKNQYCILLHTGSRGVGHQIANDYINLFENRYPISYEYLNTELGQAYFSAMKCAANFAYVNRSILSFKIKEKIITTLQLKEKDFKFDLVYDLCHNIANVETHNSKQYLVHRKGATKVFSSKELSKNHIYSKCGCPIILPASMAEDSYILKPGNYKALENVYSTVAHGSGRQLSRNEAKNKITYINLKEKLRKKGIYLNGKSENVAREEQPESYKKTKDVVESLEGANLVKKVCKLSPKVVITG
jgi:tRNA-splicing ligase RtcB (3'-phosphate/5'-hydroxy nucleic acid ligase)